MIIWNIQKKIKDLSPNIKKSKIVFRLVDRVLHHVTFVVSQEFYCTATGTTVVKHKLNTEGLNYRSTTYTWDRIDIWDRELFAELCWLVVIGRRPLLGQRMSWFWQVATQAGRRQETTRPEIPQSQAGFQSPSVYGDHTTCENYKHSYIYQHRIIHYGFVETNLFYLNTWHIMWKIIAGTVIFCEFLIKLKSHGESIFRTSK